MKLSHAETDSLVLILFRETIPEMISKVSLLLEVSLVSPNPEPTSPPTGKDSTTQVTPKISSSLTQPQTSSLVTDTLETEFPPAQILPNLAMGSPPSTLIKANSKTEAMH